MSDEDFEFSVVAVVFTLFSSWYACGLSNWLLTLIISSFFVEPTPAFAQIPSYYHDDTLDTINGSILYLTNFSGAGNSDSNTIVQDTNRATVNAEQIGLMLNGTVTNGAFQFGSNGVGAPTVLSNEAVAAGAVFSNLWSSNSFAGSLTTSGLSTNFDGSGGNMTASASQIAMPSVTFPGPHLSLPYGGVATTWTPPSLDLVFADVASFAPALSTWAPIVRSFILLIFNFSFFLWALECLREALKDTMQQRQLEGNKQEILGVNLSIVTATVLAGILIFYISQVISSGSVTAPLSAGASGVATLKTTVSGATAWPGWDILTAFLPITAMLSSFISWMAWRYLVMVPSFAFVQAIVLFFLA